MIETVPLTRPEGRPFDPPRELAELPPLVRMRYADGHVGWLATGHATVRAVLADPRFSSRTELMHMPIPSMGTEPLPPPPPGMFTDMDAPEHTRYRRLLTGQFTVRRMRQLTERIEQITAETLSAMEKQGPAVDLVEAFARPIPALVICELLGVSWDDRDQFQQHAATLVSEAGGDIAAAYVALHGFLRELVLAKRASPTDDMLSGLTTSDLTDEELTNIGVVLLGAGLDTTTHLISLSTYALLREPEHIVALQENPALAVEELLRYLCVIPFTVRATLEDVELGGELVRAGDSVTLGLLTANRDPAQFPDPDVLNLRRHSSGHVTYGHGVHQCIGQQLARIETQIALPALFSRFPDLRLAGEVPMRVDSLVHGVHRLPVAWGPQR